MNSDRRFLFILQAAFVALLFSSAAFAGPPFQTDDPEPVPFHHYEAYLFTVVDHSGGETLSALPAFEFNVGAAPNLQLHLIVPGAYLHPEGAYGIGDIELGAKYRFLKETSGHPEMGIFPLVEFPSGNAPLGLGNGKLWLRLPLWIQKTHGPWTTYGGGGYQVNRAPGAKDSGFAGWLLQRSITKRLTLGGETYFQSAQDVESRETTFIDGGGYYYFTPNLQLLFMSGHTVAGESHTTGYLGLYYTW